MCLLTVMSPGSIPTREQLIRAAKSNPHGFGYAFMFDDRIVTSRGMDAVEMIDRFLEIRHRTPDTWAMFHHRYTTHGTSTKGNCHPFRVGGDEEIVLAHNGIISAMPYDEKRSDTRIFAEDYLPDLLELLDDKDGREMLEDFIGWSKVAVFSLSEKLKSNVYILNEDSGHWDNGIWWSNDSYKEKKVSAYGWGSSWSNYDMDEDEDEDYTVIASRSKSGWWKNGITQMCIFCNSLMSDRNWDMGYCSDCFSCLECAQNISDCDCDTKAATTSYKYWWEEVEA